MTAWQPGDPLYTHPRAYYDAPGVGEVRRIFDVLDLDYPLAAVRSARWPNPHEIHDLDAQEGER